MEGSGDKGGGAPPRNKFGRRRDGRGGSRGWFPLEASGRGQFPEGNNGRRGGYKPKMFDLYDPSGSMGDAGMGTRQTWEPRPRAAGFDMTPVSDDSWGESTGGADLEAAEKERQATLVKDEDYYRYEYVPTGPAPEQEFHFETPQTDEHLKALKFMKDLRDERSLLIDSTGRVVFDCRTIHGFLNMCQFCDGRRGPWARNQTRKDAAFDRYQSSFTSMTGTRRQPEVDLEYKPTLPKELGSEDVETEVGLDEEYGVDASEFSVAGTVGTE